MTSKGYGRIMNEKRNELIRIVVNGNPGLIPFMYQLAHYVKCNMFLEWLIKNNIIGRNLIDWLKIYHQNSIMNMVKFIIKSHNKNKEYHPIILNKDWIG